MDGAALRTLFPYVAAAICLLPLAFLRGWKVYDRRLDRLLSTALILVAAAVAGLTDLGTDVIEYRAYYGQLSVSAGRSGWWEPAFEQLAVLFASAGASYGLFVFVCVLGSHLIKFYVYDRTTSNTLQAFFVLFCFNLGEIAFVRQYVAASLILLSYYCFTRQRNIAGILVMLVAVFIHKTALIAGLLVILIYFGRASLRPLLLIALAAVLSVLVLPTSVLESIQGRVTGQIASYTVQGFVQGVQGMQSEEVSLARNYAKFLVYIALALWMAMVPASTEKERVQRKAAHIVLAISTVSVILIGALSPVFTRLSAYVFPFLALSMRAERFAFRYSQIVPQCALAGLLVANLIIVIAPLVDYL